MIPRLTRIRIVGFKSFAEPVSLDILPGLTGIVGPNGCGKSNVAEALRWAMGETSARSLRGGEMDDVIFAGTAARASRNLAEVTVTLEAGGSPLPTPFEAEAELQVTRRIERGAGSTFRANGRELRARDVQTLFADLASGARSSGMVSQGRVADLVRARPEERRQVLEEAAGITGLHARRHEAELKLRAAEQNLARTADLQAQQEGTRDTLRRQARQAARYRAVSSLIRTAEAEHLAILHAKAEAALNQAQAAFQAAEAARAASLDEETDAAAALTDAEAAPAHLRERASAARSTLEQCRLKAAVLAADTQRAAQEMEAAEARVHELASDLHGAVQAEHDARQTVQRLSIGADAQAARLSMLPAETDLADRQARQARIALHTAQAQADETADRVRAAASAAQQARATLQTAAARLAVLQGHHAALTVEHAACRAARIGDDHLAHAAAETARAEAALSTARTDLDAAEAARADAADAVYPARSSSDREHARRQSAANDFANAAARARQLGMALRAADDALQQQRSERLAPQALPAAIEAAARADAELAASEAALDAAEQALSNAAADAASARRALEDASAAEMLACDTLSAAKSRAGRIASDLQAAQTAWAAAGSGPDATQLAHAASLCCQAEQVSVAHHAAWADAKQAHRSAAQALGDARAALSCAGADAARLRAETEGLKAALGDDDGRPDLLGTLLVPDGLELAFGAAFADAANATLNEFGHRWWRNLPPVAPGPLPAGSVALSSLLTAPAVLSRFLSHVVLLDSAVDGNAVQLVLTPGMMAVDRSGCCWRWDGLVTRAGAPNPAAVRLSLRRRLVETRRGLDGALQAEASAEAHLVHSEREEASCGSRLFSAEGAKAIAETAWKRAAQAADRLREDAEHAASRQSALHPSIEALRAESGIAERAVLAAENDGSAPRDLKALGQAAQEADDIHAASKQALEDARTARGAARMRAAEARQTAQTLAVEMPRAEALFEAAAEARLRAAADERHAAGALSQAQAALAALPDPATLAAALGSAEAAEADARAKEAEARLLRQLAETELDRTRQAESLVSNTHHQVETQYAGLSDRVERSRAELDEAEHHEQQAGNAVANLPDGQALGASAEAAQAALATAQEAARQAEGAALALNAERALAERGLAHSKAELEAWTSRLDEALSRRTAIAERHQAARITWQAKARPEDAAAQIARVAKALDAAEQAHRLIDEALAASDLRVLTLSAAHRTLSARTSVLRDETARLHANCQASAACLSAILARAAERLGPDTTLPQVSDHSDQAEERARAKSARLCREREGMGPVNLLAEQELEELEGGMAALERECQELGTAIAKLRGAIGHLNREGRERLLAVFAQVDAHFRTLFTRMMGGGRAHLAMTGAEDPLAAGLEIYAEPPGKKLSALSLLSGGEQALTALSLIFAVFRCTPAPLCVLDEVDAPLDDANVGRFCTLLDDMARDTGTSFLVVTHHQLTMSRMDRLFGVTMQERGVSRLLSVDLRRAAAMVGPVLQAFAAE